MKTIKNDTEKLKSFYVIRWDFNRDEVEHYDIIPYFKRVYDSLKKSERPKTFDEVKDFILKEGRYNFWARCEYETIVHSWPHRENGHEHKMDIFEQIKMNIDVITEVFTRLVQVVEERKV